MRIYKTRLAKTKYHTYIVRSDIEGADVLFDGVNIGQISNGVYYHKIKETPFNGAETGSKSFNLYRVSGTNVVPVYVTRFSVTPGGRATVNV